MPHENSYAAPICQALVSGEFPLVERLWNAYMARLKEDLRRGSLTAATLAEAGELVEWSRTTVLCMRAHAQQRLGSLHIAGAYRTAPQTPAPPLIQIRG
jgi:hypothetical protein